MGEICQVTGREISNNEPVFILNGKRMCREAHDEANPLCPYCQKELHLYPKKRTQCASCQGIVLVRREQQMFPTTLLTRKQAVLVDGLRELDKFGITHDDFIRKRGIGTDESAAGNLPSDAAIIMDLFADVMRQCQVDGERAEALDSLARFAHSIGQETYRIRRKWARRMLRNWKKSGAAARVRIDCHPDACSQCKLLNGQEIPIDEAIDSLPLPPPECQHKWNDDDRCAWCPSDYKPLGPLPKKKKSPR